jgi:hypothetical protein
MILYDINNIREVDIKKGVTDGVVPSTVSGRGSHIHSNSEVNITQGGANVKENISREDDAAFHASTDEADVDIEDTDVGYENQAAEKKMEVAKRSSTSALENRIKSREADLKALKNLKRSTGLTEAQARHMRPRIKRKKAPAFLPELPI